MEDIGDLEVFLRGRLKQRLAADELGLCFTVRLARSIEIANIAKSADYDALYLDLEHSTMPLDTVSQLCTMALEVGLTPLVRIASIEAGHIARVLDAGAMGIIVPHVSNADMARGVVRSAKYPPTGTRSISTSIPQMRAGTWPPLPAAACINRETMIIAMIESRQGLMQADEIAAVDGIDVLFIGTTDLCADLGIHGRFDDPLVDDAYRTVIAACRSHGKHAGIGGLARRPDLMARYIEQGARFVSVGSDSSFIMMSARQAARDLRSLPLPPTA